MSGDSTKPEDDSSQIQFRLEGMEVDQFSFDKRSQYTNFEEGGYALHHGLTAATNDNLILIRVVATLQSATKDSDEAENDTVDVGSASVTGSFEVRNLKELEGSDGEIQLPDEFVANLLGIVISSVRGVLLAYGSGTPVEDHPLPIVSPLRLVETTDYTEHEEWP